jgi:hypothetical protein
VDVTRSDTVILLVGDQFHFEEIRGTSRGRVERAAVVGCNAVLGKPCNPKQLLEEVRRPFASRGDRS